jgi:hypothetical protein
MMEKIHWRGPSAAFQWLRAMPPYTMYSIYKCKSNKYFKMLNPVPARAREAKDALQRPLGVVPSPDSAKEGLHGFN